MKVYFKSGLAMNISPDIVKAISESIGVATAQKKWHRIQDKDGKLVALINLQEIECIGE